MTRYQATIRHHSIARARVVDVGDDLTLAKRQATREFGGGYIDHAIVIIDTEINPAVESNIVASRKIGERKWTAR